MCIIVDANVDHEVFSDDDQASDAGRIVRNWISDGSNRLVFGGRNKEELFRRGESKRWVKRLWDAGRARQITTAEIDAEWSRLCEAGPMRSNDAHIIALARASGARTLFSHDNGLMQDFKDARFLEPKGWVFSRAGHRKVLHAKKTCCAT